MATLCCQVGRTDDAARYADAAQLAIASGRYEEVPFGFEAGLANAYLHIGQPERSVEWCRAQLARGRDTHAITRACLVLALTMAGAGDEARAAATGLIDAAEATHNPCVLSLALYVHEAAFSYAAAFRDADSVASLDTLRRGLVIAQDSGNRASASVLAASLCRLEAVYGDPLAALDYITLAIRTYHDAGNTAALRGALSILAAVFDRLGRYEPAATMAGFAVIPWTTMIAEFNTLITHLRDVLGEATYESLAARARR
jgi:tetratricopeptide (TPR) repeat protein